MLWKWWWFDKEVNKCIHPPCGISFLSGFTFIMRNKRVLMNDTVVFMFGGKIPTRDIAQAITKNFGKRIVEEFLKYGLPTSKIRVFSALVKHLHNFRGVFESDGSTSVNNLGKTLGGTNFLEYFCQSIFSFLNFEIWLILSYWIRWMITINDIILRSYKPGPSITICVACCALTLWKWCRTNCTRIM